MASTFGRVLQEYDKASTSALDVVDNDIKYLKKVTSKLKNELRASQRLNKRFNDELKDTRKRLNLVIQENLKLGKDNPTTAREILKKRQQKEMMKSIEKIKKKQRSLNKKYTKRRKNRGTKTQNKTKSITEDVNTDFDKEINRLQVDADERREQYTTGVPDENESIKQKFKDMKVYDSEYEETVQAISFAGRQVIQQWYEIKNNRNIPSPFINQSDQKLYLKHYDIFDSIPIPPITKPKKPSRLSRLFRSSKK